MSTGLEKVLGIHQKVIKEGYVAPEGQGLTTTRCRICAAALANHLLPSTLPMRCRDFGRYC